MCVSCDMRRRDFPRVDGLSTDPQVLGRHMGDMLELIKHQIKIIQVKDDNDEVDQTLGKVKLTQIKESR